MMLKTLFQEKLNKTNRCCSTGFTLIEVLIVIGLFAVISYTIYMAYYNVLEAVDRNQLRFEAISALESEIEVVRNMAFEDVGIVNGYPIGKLLAQKAVQSGDNNFTINSFVRNVDDGFDGTLGGAPSDTAPADYKIVELEISCSNCRNFVPLSLTTTVAPKGLESASQNGSLFIEVFDAYGKSISGANVSVLNASTTPTITINDITNVNGMLQLVDIPTSTSAYEIAVSKPGYSSDRTYPRNDPPNPNPAKPHATVAQQQITSVSFSIDKISMVNLSTIDKMCAVAPNVDFLQEGTKLIGVTPDVLKYSTTSQTNASGQKTISNLEWDNYQFINLDSVYDLMGSLPLLPLTINPDTTTNLKMIMTPKNPLSILITVTDENDQPFNDVSVNLTKTNFDETLFTGRNNFSQSDWSGANFFSQSGAIDAESLPGEIKLNFVAGKYATSTTEWLVSNSFDLGTSTAKFYQIDWQPDVQPVQAGPDSLKFQIATNNDNLNWNFIGPDGTDLTFYNATGTQLNVIHDNNRYLRYKAFMKTEDENTTPSLSKINFGFSSGCVPNGQAFFEGLASGSYTITAQKSGYQAFTDSALSISDNWQEYKIKLLPL